MILEGLNVLQTAPGQQGRTLFVSDFFDFSIYIDAHEDLIERWYVDRFMTLRETVFTDAKSYFHRYASLTDQEARETALRLWREINHPNLKENIEPTRERAHLILEKDADHDVAGGAAAEAVMGTVPTRQRGYRKHVVKWSFTMPVACMNA